MKRTLLPIIAAILALPSAAVEEKQEEVQPTPSTLTSNEKTRILSTASRLLSNAIAYKGDGTAITIYNSKGSRLLLEMRGLVVRRLIHGSVAIEERDAGLTRRFYAELHTESFRTSSSDGKTWSEWQSTSCPIFPSHFLVEEVDGKMTISAQELANFSPSSEQEAIDPDRELMPHERIMARR